MPREELAEAAELLERAAETAGGDAGEALRTQAEQLSALAERERGPDHGRLDRHQQALRDVRPNVPGAVADSIDEANALITEYRSTLPGV